MGEGLWALWDHDIYLMGKAEFLKLLGVIIKGGLRIVWMIPMYVNIITIMKLIVISLVRLSSIYNWYAD